MTVPANSGTVLAVTLNVPAKTAGDSSDFRDVAGEITFTPRSGANNGVALAVPYYLVPQATSEIRTALNMTQLHKRHSTTAVVGNIGGVIPVTRTGTRGASPTRTTAWVPTTSGRPACSRSRVTACWPSG